MNLSLEHRQQIPLFDATEVFSSLRSEGAPAFLFESRSVNPIYGRMSLLGVDPILEISGQESHISFSVLQERGQVFFDEFLSSGIEEMPQKFFPPFVPKVLRHFSLNLDR
jgi:hypothetical protein